MLSINDSQFESEVLNSKGLVLVDFLGGMVRPLPPARPDLGRSRQKHG